MIELLVGFLLLVLLGGLVTAVVAIYFSLPLADALNLFLRRVGLAGASRGTRAAGVAATGTVDEPFVIRPGREPGRGTVFVGGEVWNAVCPAALARELVVGDRVEVVYNDDLTVTVIERAGSPARRAVRSAG